MEKTYDPKQIEKDCYHTWEHNHYFAPRGNNAPYCIVLPPPNVTGSLHMGHGFQHTLMDALIRYQRMSGKKTLWQPGTDHAGIATQMVVERQLLAQGLTRHQLGRELFVEKIQEWKIKSGGEITKQLRRMGSSVDWSRERFTMDPEFCSAVQKTFIDLHEQGLIYRGLRLTNWDPVLQTAVSDLEVISEEEQGSMWFIRYPLVSENNFIIVATTRPETLLGDVAVAVHPDDKRYQHYIGKHVALPLTERTIPIIADDSIDPTFGTGCVKITPAHDFNDNLMGKRHQLPMINIFTDTAHLNDDVPEVYRGLERFAARKKIVADLEVQNLLEKIEPHTLKVPRGDRSGAVIEPYLTYQWFVKMEPLAKPAMAAVEKGETKFVPENWRKTYFQWLENIEDWCISRQLWWGHRIPAWYDIHGKYYVGDSEADVRARYGIAENEKLTQDQDVLDTWFSASLWPLVTLGWPENLTDFYTTDVLVTGFDIIFFWVARMMMMSLHLVGRVPFKEVYITGLVRDASGQKMSKSKGNVLDPIDVIDGISLEDLIAKRTQGMMQPKLSEKITKETRKDFPEGIAAFGTDALRFTYCALASTGRNVNFDLARVAGYRNFCNKIWNAARFVMMNVGDAAVDVTIKPQHPINRAMISILQKTIIATHEHLKNYRFDWLAQSLYELVWNEYCDWYLELTKVLLQQPEFKEETRLVLLSVLEQMLRLLHPVMPFITESIWQSIALRLNIKGATIMLQPFPTAQNDDIDEVALTEYAWLKSIVIALRNVRGELKVAPNVMISVLLKKGDAVDRTRMQQYTAAIGALARVKSINWIQEGDDIPQAATALVGALEILVPLEGLLDLKAEALRLDKEIAKLQIELTRAQTKLANPNYVEKAPVQVVEQERARVAEFLTAIEKLQGQRNKMV